MGRRDSGLRQYGQKPCHLTGPVWLAGIAVWLRIAGAAAQPIAACAARYRVRGGAQIHCRSQRSGDPGAPGDATAGVPGRSIAVRIRVGGVAQIHCRSQGAPGDASRRIAVRIRIAGAATQPIAGCTPAPTRVMAQHKCVVEASVHLAMQRRAFRPVRTAVWLRIAGGAAQRATGSVVLRKSF